MLPSHHLRVVPSGPRSGPAPVARKSSAVPGPDRGDLAVLGMLFGVNLVPLVGAAVTRGGWGAGTLGLATAGALVTGRELVLGARALLRRAR